MTIKSVPDSIRQLQKRVTALERKLGGTWPADICQACGARALRLHQARSGLKGNVEKLWRCAVCGIIDDDARSLTRLLRVAQRDRRDLFPRLHASIPTHSDGRSNGPHQYFAIHQQERSRTKIRTEYIRI
jgi:hypothetical protein